jgi:uncharacterized protein YkwD
MENSRQRWYKGRGSTTPGPEWSSSEVALREAVVNTVRPGLLVLTVLLFSCGFDNTRPLNEENYAQSRPAGPGNGLSAAPVEHEKPAHDPGPAPTGSVSPGWTRGSVDTTAGADYLSEVEKQVVIEINMLRTDPAQYARRFLVPLRSYYQGALVRLPGERPVSTYEGIRALDESIRELAVAKPVSPLFPKKGLTSAARDLARDQGRTGATGHVGSDGSTDESRINRYGRWGISAGENISYGPGDARGIVTSLLIDDGVPSRGHRRNLLNGTFGFVGTAVGPHRLYGHMCVLDFAGSYP